MVTVLVTGCGGAIGLCAIKGLRLKKNNLRIVGVDTDPYSAFFYLKDQNVLFDKTYVISNAEEQEYISQLSELCQRERVDVILPCTDAELEKLSAAKNMLEEHGTKVIVSPSETIQICRDKWLTYNHLHRFLPMVKSALPDLGIEKALRYTGLPAIVKPRFGWGSKYVYQVNSVEEAQAVVSNIDKPIIQTALEGEEYTVDCLANKQGKFICGVPRSRLRIYGGLSFQGVTVRDYELIELGKKFTKHLKLVGPFNFQLRKNHGKPTIFEVNARLAGTSILSIRAGVNFPLLAVKDMCNMKLPAHVDFKEGLVVSRYFKEVFFKKEDGKIS